MKTIKTKLAGFILLVLASASLFLTCDVGLGNSVSTKPPTVSITSPAANSDIAGTLAMTGAAAADTSLASVAVTFIETTSGSKYGPFAATVDATAKAWSIDLNKTAGSREIPDGTYKVSVVATDSAKRTSEANTVYQIDNTAPTVMVTSPLTYGSGNQVTFYRTIDIKGESYDSSTISAVDVFILKANGSVVQTASGKDLKTTADGKTTWSARFDYATVKDLLTSGQPYLYKIVASDAAGNSNAYYFHRADIYPLLNQTAGYVVFPSMNQIGRLDQGLAASTDQGLSPSILQSVRHWTSFVSPLTQAFADFIYKSDEAPDVEWLNIKSDTVGVNAVIGLDIPVVGTIMPPSDGSAIKKDTVKFRIGDAATAYDAAVAQTGVTLTSVGTSLNFEVQPKNASSVNLPSGDFIIWLDYTTGSNISYNKISQGFTISSGTPKFYTDKSESAAMLFSVTSNIRASTSIDGYVCDASNIALDNVSYSLNEAAGITVPCDWDPVGKAHTGSTTGYFHIPVDVGGSGLADGQYTYIVTAGSGMTATLSRTFNVSTKAPSVSLNMTASDSDTGRYNGNVAIKGSITADSALKSVYWQISASNTSPAYDADKARAADTATNVGAGWTQVSSNLSSLNETWNSTAYGTVSDQSMYVWILACDSYGNISIGDNASTPHTNKTITVNQLTDKPKVPLTNANVNALIVTSSVNCFDTSSNNKILGKVTDDDGLNLVTVNLYAADGTTLISSTPYDLSATKPTTYSLSYALPATESDYKVEIVAIDSALHVSGTTGVFPVAVDAGAPVFSISSPAQGQYHQANASITVTGTVQDGSGSVTLSGVTPAQGPFTDSALHAWTDSITTEATTGAYSRTYTATDKYGNASQATFTYKVDKTAPTLAIASMATGYYDTQISVSGTASDNESGLQKVQFMVDANRNGARDETWVDATGKDSWYKNNIDISALPEGTNTVWVRALDYQNNEIIESTTFTVDHSNPALAIDSSFDGIVYKNGLFTINGFVSDTLGLASTPVSITAKKNSAAHSLTTPALVYNSGTGAWSRDINVSGSGSYELTITATDGVGRQTVATRTVTVDVTPPSVEIASFNSFATGIKVNGTVTFNALASDANGIAGTKYFITTSNTDPGYAASVGYPSSVVQVLAGQSIDTTSLTDNATYYLWVVAQDRAGNSGSISTQFNVDQSTDKPVVAFSNVGTGSTHDGSGEAGNNLIVSGGTIAGTITDDDGIGSAAISVWTGAGAPVVTNAALTLTGASTKSKDFSYSVSSLSNGAYYFKVSAADTNTVPVASLDIGDTWFAYDTAEPVVTLDTKDTAAVTIGPYRNASFSVKGTINDANGVVATEISYDNGSTWTALSSGGTAGAGATQGWSQAVGVTGNNGSKTIQIRATDTYGRKGVSVNKINVTLDDVAPAAPTITSTAAAYVSSSLSVGGTASDATSGVKSVYYRIDGAAGDAATGTLTGTNTWFGTPDISSGSLAQGSHTVYIWSEDNAGNKSAESSQSFMKDTDPPVIDETEIATTNTQYRIADTLFKGAASDTNLLSSVKVSIKKDGAAWLTNFDLTSGMSGTQWSYTFPATGLTAPGDNGTYVLVFTATDAAGRTSAVTRTVVVDNLPPSVTLSTSLAGWKSADFGISGTCGDTGGSGLSYVEYKLGASGSWTAASITGGTWTASLSLSGSAEGSIPLSIRATDGAGNSTTSSNTVKVDLANPVVSETTVNTTDTQYWNDDAVRTFGGKATDSNALSSLTVSINGGAASAVPVDADGPDNISGNADDGAWTYTFNASVADSTYALVFTATDAANKTSTIAQTVVVDNTDPTVGITAIPGYQSGTVALLGTSVDTNLTLVEYQLDGTAAGSWTTASGTSSWTGLVNMSAASETAHTLYYRAFDRAGNASAIESTSIKVDRANPQATETNYTSALIQRKNAVTFTGIADDAEKTTGRAATSAILTYSKDGAAAVTVTAGAGANEFHLNGATGVWDWTMPATIGDGLYVVSLTVTDEAGKVSTVSRTVQMDTTGPTITIANPGAGLASTSSTININGTSRDTGGVGFAGAAADAEYSLNSTDGINGTWTNLGSLSGSINWSATGISIGAVEGAKKLYIRSTDKVGNYSTACVDFYYDLAPPALTETTVNTTDTQYWNNSAVRTFDGKTSDSNALSSLKVSINGGAESAVTVDADGPDDIAGNSDDGAWTYPFNTAVADGSYAVVFTATDVANKTTQLTRTVYIDKQSPSIASVTDLHTAWNITSSKTVSGTASDTGGSGLAVVEYRISANNGTSWGGWSSLTGTTSFSGTASFDDGDDNILEVRATDRAGNQSVVNQQTVRVDTLDPSFEITSPVTTPISNGSGALAITISATDDTSGAVTACAKVNSYDFTSGTIYSSAISGGVATLNVTDLTALGAGTKKIYLRVSDASGRNSIVMAQSIIIDKSAPTVDFSTPADGATVNKTISLTGTASDANGLGASAAFQIQQASDSAWVAAPSGSITASTSWTVSGFDTTAITDGGGYDMNAAAGAISINVRVAITDVAGNTGYATKTLVVDQDSDRPVVKLSNVNIDGTTTLKMTNDVYGTVTDDDGISTFEISGNGSAWTTITPVGGAWSYTANVPAGDGQKNLYFRVKDSAGTIFTTGDLTNLPKIQYASSVTSSVVSFKVDTLAPVLSSVNPVVIDRTSAYDFADATAITANMPLGGGSGGIYSKFRLRVLAKDANGIKSVSISVPGASGSPFTATANGLDTTEPTFTRFDTDVGGIDVSSIADGAVTITVTVTDNSDLTSSVNRVVLIDNHAPNITHSSPRSVQDVVNGDTTIKGLSDDGTGSGVDSIKYQVGLCADRSAGSFSWIATTGTKFSWEIALTGTNKIDNYGGVSVSLDAGTDTFTKAAHGYTDGTVVWFDGSTLPTGMSTTVPYYVINATANTFNVSTSSGGSVVDFSGSSASLAVSKYSKDVDNDGIWELPIMIRAEDLAGNILIEDYTTYVVLVDPSGDKPKVSIVYPDPANINRIMGGTIRLFGTATDDDAVGSVWMQIDVNGDGLYTSADVDTTSKDWYNGNSGQQVSGTASWNQTINASHEFDPTGAGNRTIHFRVRAQDIYGTYGNWSTDQTIKVDKNIPKIGSTYALIMTQGAASRNYVADMWISGTWYLTGSIEDESGISAVTVSSTEPSLNGDLGSKPAWFMAATYGASSSSGYNMNIPIPTTGTGSLSFTVTATDNSDPKTSKSETFTINYDNDAPTIGSYTGSLPVTQSNKVYSLTSSVTETGSGFDKIVFYFERNVTPDANDRVYNPMEARTGNVNRTYLSSLTWNQGLPCIALTGVTRSSAYSLTAASIKTDMNIRKGGLVFIGGIYQYILLVDRTAGTITWADPVDIGTTTASVAYAMVVNNTTVETPVWSGDVLSSITNDDGDGMVEAVERSGGLYNWTASIDSRNIPDGPIEIHFVAFDKAGNYTTGTKATSVSNNLPLLAKVTIGTDLDGSGTIIASEKAEFTALDGSGNKQSTATAASSSFILKDLSSVDIDVVGGNGILDYDLSVGGTAVTGHNDPVNSPYLRDTEGGSINTITLTAAQLAAAPIGDTIVGGVAGAAKTLVFKIWDSTEEMTRGSSSQCATLNVPVQVDITDDVKPTAKITPFFWNSSSDNSLYGNSKAYGHIELTGVVGDTDPDVSGQISIRGTAYDDQRLSSLWISIADSSKADRFSFSGSSQTKQVDGKTYYKVATYNPVTSAWVGSDQMTTYGWKFTVTPVSLTQGGHTVSWQLDWDTSEVKTSTGLLVAALNNLVRVQAEDKAATPNSSDESTVQTADGAQTPYYKIDIVPYITGITRSGVNTNRSRYGVYPLRKNETGIAISGFNLGGSATLPVARVAGTGSGGTAGVGTQVTVSGTAGSGGYMVNHYVSLSVTGSELANSGYLVVTVNSAPSINNIDQNSAWNKESGNSGTEDYAYWYDDRYLHVWQTGQTFNGSSGAKYPSMSIDNAGALYGAWINYGTSILYTNTVSGTAATRFYTYDPPEYTDLYIDPNQNRMSLAFLGDYYGGSGWNSTHDLTNSGSMGLYSSAAPSVNSGNGNMNRVYAFDDLYHDTQLWQFARPKTVRYAADATQANDRLHTVYFDTYRSAVKYSYSLDDSLTGEKGWITIDGAGDPYVYGNSDSRPTNATFIDNTLIGYAGISVGNAIVVNGNSRTVSSYNSSTGQVGFSGATIAVGTAISYTITPTTPSAVPTGTGIASSSLAGEYVAVDVDESGYPAIAYYDIANQTLKLARATTADPSRYGDWVRQNVFPSGDTNAQFSGQHVAMKFDPLGGLHIVCYRSSTGDLLYLYAPNPAAEGDPYVFQSSVIVDSIGAVGAWADISLEGVIPHVSYMNSSMLGTFDGLKYATKRQVRSSVTSATTTSITATSLIGNTLIGVGDTVVIYPTTTTNSADSRTITAFDSATGQISWSGALGFTPPSGRRFVVAKANASDRASEWESMIVPSSAAVSDQRSNIEVRRGTATWGEVALGYLTNRFELMYLQAEP